MMKFIIKSYRNHVAILLMLISLISLAGCAKGPNFIDSHSISEVKVYKMLPIEGEAQGYDSELIDTISNKNTINQLISGIEKSQVGDKELSYAKEHILHYEIRFVYKNIDKHAVSLWLADDMNKAVISTIGYYYLDENTTDIIRELIN